MCEFFSFVSNGDGKPLFFNWGQRKQILKGTLFFENGKKVENPDSHTSIAEFYGFVGGMEDKLNKYEYNPLLKKFKIDQLNNPRDDSKELEKWVENLDFKTICKPLVLKEIINPFKKFPKKQAPTEEDLENLRKWVSVWVSVGASVGASVGDSVWDSMWDSVWDSVGDSVWASVWDSVRDSVWVFVRASVRDSMWASVRAYLSSFVDLEYKADFSPLVKLWEKGFVPSFDGKTWRLHSGKNAEIVWEGEI